MVIPMLRTFFLTLLPLYILLGDLADSSPLPPFPEAARPTKSGYLPVNSSSSSSIFYAFYEAQFPLASLSQTPLLVWLQGGPGCSSMIGNFLELGPWRVNDRGSALRRNPGAWNRIFGLLFLDNPIGTGFSVAAGGDEIPRNQRRVAEHLYAAISGFIKSNTGFGNRPVYITGESYAGKYVPVIGYYILKEKPNESVKLQGLAIGNGLTDPETQIATHADNAYYSGLINEKQKSEIERKQRETIELIRAKKWEEATEARTRLLRKLQNITGLATLYDFSKKAIYNTGAVEKFMNNTEVKTALGVKPTFHFEHCSDVVKAALHEDIMKSVKFMVDYLVRSTRVLLYQGHLDLRDGVVSNEAWMRTLSWPGLADFQNTDRKIWRDGNGVLAGYVRNWKNLSQVVVMNAGHLVPTDQAINSQAMIEDWVMERGFFSGYGGMIPKGGIFHRDRAAV